LGGLRACLGRGRAGGAIDALARAKRRAPPPEPLLVAGADLALQRGEPDLALELLDGGSGSAALLLAADIRAERGELALALTLMERVLARDIDAPGARERHERWRAQLGGGRAPALPLDAPTELAAEAPETSLRIVGEAGRGGAATVYEALDEVLGRKVALKVYHRPAEDRDKLEREARLAVQMAGGGVVRIFDADPARGFIVMEWAGGGALKRWITRADVAMLWPIERWLEPLARALERVHALGFVHGDLKPANVLFRSAGDPVLSDFGLAHPIGSVIDGGSFGYLSPERLLGEAVTAADDVYGLGRILEDALDALGRAPEAERPPAEALARWRQVARAALTPLAARPAGVAALLDGQSC
jgi:serine/threonine-protein kinase